MLFRLWTKKIFFVFHQFLEDNLLRYRECTVLRHINILCVGKHFTTGLLVPTFTNFILILPYCYQLLPNEIETQYIKYDNHDIISNLLWGGGGGGGGGGGSIVCNNTKKLSCALAVFTTAESWMHLCSSHQYLVVLVISMHWYRAD